MNKQEINLDDEKGTKDPKFNAGLLYVTRLHECQVTINKCLFYDLTFMLEKAILSFYSELSPRLKDEDEIKKNKEYYQKVKKLSSGLNTGVAAMGSEVISEYVSWKPHSDGSGDRLYNNERRDQLMALKETLFQWNLYLRECMERNKLNMPDRKDVLDAAEV